MRIAVDSTAVFFPVKVARGGPVVDAVQDAVIITGFAGAVLSSVI